MSERADLGPNVIGASGGSGTRVVARIVRQAGLFIGEHLNESEDALDFRLWADRWINPFWGADGGPLTPSAEAEMLREFEAALARHLAPLGPEPRPWGWKQPRTVLLLPFLDRRFPRLKFLHVVRDGRDMAFSSHQKPLQKHGSAFLSSEELCWPPPLQSVALWTRVNLRAAEYGERHLGDRYLRIRFEDLCVEPTAVVESVCRFFGLSGDSRRIAECEVAPPGPTGRWQAQDAGLVSDLHRIARPALERFGYSADRPEDPRVGGAERAAVE